MDCNVVFLNENKEFFEPGEKFKAQVTLNVRKTEKILKISCTVRGYAKCKWYEQIAGGQGAEQYWNRDELFTETFVLVGSSVELKSGEHNFDVAHLLPENLPTSFECNNGAIIYKLEVSVERSWKKNLSYIFPFTVVRPMNLNESGGLHYPVKEELSKNFTLSSGSEPLYLSASIPFAGYVSGQTIDVTIQVNNESKALVKEVKVSLKKVVSLNSKLPRKKTFQLIIPEAKVSSEPVPSLSKKTFEKPIVVPPLPPSILNCDVVLVQYELRVKAMMRGMNRSPKIKLPITIGTVPLVFDSGRNLQFSWTRSMSRDEEENAPRSPAYDFEQQEGEKPRSSYHT